MTAATADTTLHKDTSFIGHPWGLAWLSGSEFWERFSYYGMQALLVLYMTKQLLLPGHVEHVVALGRFARRSNISRGRFRRWRWAR